MELLFVVAVVVGWFVSLILDGQREEKQRLADAAELERMIALPALHFLREFDGLTRASERAAQDYERAVRTGRLAPNVPVRGGGYIYVVPARLRKIDGRYSFRSEAPQISDKLNGIFGEYDGYKLMNGNAACAFKVGFTTRSAAQRIAELNCSSSGNYGRWEFKTNWHAYFQYDHSIEQIEQRLHTALAPSRILGELYWTSFFHIELVLLRDIGILPTKKFLSTNAVPLQNQ